MLRAVIDTNIFLSGILFGGNPEKVLRRWIKKDFILCFSPALQAEIIQKLQVKFHASDAMIHELLSLIDNTAEKYMPISRTPLVRDPKDNSLLELAEDSHADYLITGDKDLLALKEHKETVIILPIDFLSILKKK